jgi:hypothetical protein
MLGLFTQNAQTLLGAARMGFGHTLTQTLSLREKAIKGFPLP